MDNPLREYVRRIDKGGEGMMDYINMDRGEDQVLNCVDCDAEFIFTIGEQQFYREKELHPTKRCKNCRDARKRDREHSQ